MVAHLRRILCVDDEADIRRVAALALEAIGGFTVLTCESGRDAVEVAPGFAPDLLLLDMNMPDMDGPATLAALRSVDGLADTPVVFLTAEARTGEVERLEALGALGVIAKPFDPMTLPDQVRRLWSGAAH